MCASLMAQSSELVELDLVAMQGDPKCGICNPKPTPTDVAPCFMRGDDALVGMPMTAMAPAAYTYPGNITLTDGWDIYGDISYLYWYAKQEGLDIGATGYQYVSTTWALANTGGKTIIQDADYTSGFRLGIGGELPGDEWSIDLTYTYLRQETETKKGNLPTSLSFSGSPAYYNASTWFQFVYYGGSPMAQSFTSKWNMNLDWLDLQLSRPYYQSRRMIVTPSAGIRASWIRQKMHIATPYLFNGYGSDAGMNAVSSNYSNSWAIGPRALADIHWIIAQGFRLQGSFGASVLFTQYTHITHRETGVYLSTPTGGNEGRIDDYNCLRAMAEANLGFGWGSYIYQKKYHIDFTALYDFNYLWSQNMIRYLLGTTNPIATSGTAGDLILHGLELKARFDF